MKTLVGKIASQGSAVAQVFITNDPREAAPAEKYILVTQNADPEISPLLYGASGIVTEVGGLMSHLAVVSREMQIPCITACEGCYEELRSREIIEIDALDKLNSRVNINYDK